MKPSDEAKAKVKRIIPCLCDAAYKDRGLTAPDCPWHNYGEDVAELLDAHAAEARRAALEEAAVLCEQHANFRDVLIGIALATELATSGSPGDHGPK